MGYLVSKRKKIFIPAGGSLEIRVDFDSDKNEHPRVWIQCSACGDEVFENKSRKLFECPECGIEATEPELSALGKKYIESVRDRFSIKEEKKGILWRLATWFAKSKKLPAPRN